MPAPDTTGLLAGKRGVILGVATARSIAWGIAQAAEAAGAELAFTAQNEALAAKVRSLAGSMTALPVLLCDVASEGEIARALDAVQEAWPEGPDFIVHSLAAANHEDLAGPYHRTSAAGFAKALEISCYSLTELVREAAPRLRPGGSFLTLTYLGAERAVPSYNVMGVAKAALEASVRYLAADIGPSGLRINALSAGPVRSISGAGISAGRFIYGWSEAEAPLRANPAPQTIGQSAVYLLSPLASAVTGEVLHVDGGLHAIAIARPEGHGPEGRRPEGRGPEGS